jgi:neutral ceramidase
MFGLWPVRWLPAVDPIVGWIRGHIRGGTAGAEPWLPTRLPLHLLRVGSLVVCTLPFETTTVAGRRLRATLRAHLPEDVEQIVICTYANAYCGYLTTFEEYQVQRYEAGYTVFGPITLGAVQTELVRLAGRWVDADAPRVVGALPERVPQERVDAVPFVAPWPA